MDKEEKERNRELYSYLARKLNEYLDEREKVTASTIEREFRDGRMNVKHYLLMCKIFKVQPNLNLHSRIHSPRIHHTRPITSEMDFRRPVTYRDTDEKATTIEESEEGFFVITESGRLCARKWKTRYGGEWWGLTVIDYETERGVYTVAKEAGELWSPHSRPWYTQIADKALIGFKTAQTLKDLVQTIIERTDSSLEKIREITGVNTSVLRGIRVGEGDKAVKSIKLRHLLTLLALKSLLAQTDIREDIKRCEKEIDAIKGRKIPEELRKNILYINLRTPFGASLIGHLVCYGQLHRRGEGLIFEYANAEQECVEDVSKLLKFYGYPGNIQRRKGEKSERGEYYVSATGFLAYALWCAIPRAEGDITLNNPEVPSWVTDDPVLAASFLRAIILDKAYINPETKEMTISFDVDVTEELDEKGLGQPIRDIVDKRLKELREKRDL